MCQHNKLIPLWRIYWAQAIGIIFVIDSTNQNEWKEAEGEIELLQSEAALLGCPFLFLLNKLDENPHVGSLTQLEEAITQRVGGSRHFRVCRGTAREPRMLEDIQEFLDYVKSNPRDLPPVQPEKM